MAELMPYTVAVVRATDQDQQGREVILSFSFMGEDHEDAARQAFKYAGDGSRLRVREITTYDGLPSKRWWPKFDVAGDLEQV